MIFVSFLTYFCYNNIFVPNIQIIINNYIIAEINEHQAYLIADRRDHVPQSQVPFISLRLNRLNINMSKQNQIKVNRKKLPFDFFSKNSERSERSYSKDRIN